MSHVSLAQSGQRVVLFTIGEDRYGLSVDQVREVQKIVAFTGAPVHSDVVLGMVNVRGTLAPVIDMHVVVGLSSGMYTPETPMVLCATGDDHLLALLVDEVEDVCWIAETDVRQAPSLHPLAANLVGVCRCGESQVYLLDIDALFEHVSAVGLV